MALACEPQSALPSTLHVGSDDSQVSFGYSFLIATTEAKRHDQNR
jgi:hypothetical protein